ncbi:MAG: tetratricopeptide repeat protein [Sphingomicrobium sp.]
MALAAGAAYWLPGSAPADGASIAVLPFRNLGGDAEDGYFSDGLAEELRATLSRIDQLAVVAEASSDRFRDGKADARTMAKALGVAFLMEGSVRRSSDLIRVSTRIVDGETGFDKWSQSFDRNVSDALSIQSAIAAFVTDALLAGLAREQRPSERIGGTRDPKAFDAFLRGSALYRSAGGETSDFAALKKFDDAIAVDAKYAAAHAARSRALTVIANNYASPSEIPAYYQRSIGAAQAAVHLAPRMAEGHSALGFALFNGQLDALAAAGPYQRSFEFGFGNAEILSAYAIFAARTGRFDDGRQAIARAERLDPLNPTVFRNAGLLEYSARNYDGAEAPFRTALSLNPKARIVHSALGDIAIMQGDAAAARKLYEQEPDDASRWRGLAIADMKLGRIADAQRDYEMLVKVGEGVSHYQQAQVAAQWGKVGDALGFLERALALRDAGLVRLRNDPLLDALRQEPRFTSIEQKIGFA